MSLCGLQRFNLRENCRSAYGLGKTIFKISYGEVYRRIYGLNHVLRLRLRIAVKKLTSSNENFEYNYPLNIWASVRDFETYRISVQ